jgi:hypothetical protein
MDETVPREALPVASALLWNIASMRFVSGSYGQSDDDAAASGTTGAIVIRDFARRTY